MQAIRTTPRIEGERSDAVSTPTWLGATGALGYPAGMRGFLIGISISLAFIVGCVAGSSRYGVPRAEASAVVEQRWSYFCFEASTVDDVHFKSNAAGMRGWEMASSATNGSGQIIWCFRQPRP